MPGSFLSSHVPDPDLIAYHAERNATWFSRTSPWTKAAFLVWLVIAVTVLGSPVATGLLLLAVIAVYASCGLPLGKLAAWCVIPVIFVVSLVILMIGSVPGTALLTLTLPGWTATLTTGGLLVLAQLTAKALIPVIFSLTVIMTTRMAELSALVSRVMPSPADQIFLIAYRFLFVTLSTLSAMLAAMKSRGGLVSGLFSRSRMMAGIFGHLFIRSFERSERVMKAMQSRGYTHDFTAMTPVPRPAIPGIIFTGGVFVLLVAAAVSGSLSGGVP